MVVCNILIFWHKDLVFLWAISHKNLNENKKGFEYVTACTMNLQYMKVKTSSVTYITEENELLHNILIFWHGFVWELSNKGCIKSNQQTTL